MFLDPEAAPGYSRRRQGGPAAGEPPLVPTAGGDHDGIRPLVRYDVLAKEEAEYSATLAFAIAVSVSWWAVRDGHARLHVPRMPPLEACGRRQHWLDIDPRAMRSWAMTPLAITLGLPPLHPEERARLPTVVRVADVLADGKLPPDVVYVGQGHHSHRVPRSQWASPFVQGHTCTTDDWLPLYVDFVLANLQAELPALQGKRLAIAARTVSAKQMRWPGWSLMRPIRMPRPACPESLGGGTGRPGALWSGRRLSWARSEAVTP